MRKIITIVAVLVAVSTVAISISWAAEAASAEKISTTIILRNDWYSPNDGKAIDLQWYTAYWHYRNFGGGVDVNINPSADYTRIRPFVTLNSGPWYVLAGAAYSNIEEYAQLGLRYINSINGFNVVFDLRNYIGLDLNSPSYSDNFVEVTHPIGEKFFVGVDMLYDHWWEGDSHDVLLVGPVFGYHFTKTIAAYVRVSHDWNFREAGTKEGNGIRLGLIFNF
jgi:hypothetical protein